MQKGLGPPRGGGGELAWEEDQEVFSIYFTDSTNVLYKTNVLIMTQKDLFQFLVISLLELGHCQI